MKQVSPSLLLLDALWTKPLNSHNDDGRVSQTNGSGNQQQETTLAAFNEFSFPIWQIKSFRQQLIVSQVYFESAVIGILRAVIQLPLKQTKALVKFFVRIYWLKMFNRNENWLNRLNKKVCLVSLFSLTVLITACTISRRCRIYHWVSVNGVVVVGVCHWHGVLNCFFLISLISNQQLNVVYILVEKSRKLESLFTHFTFSCRICALIWRKMAFFVCSLH